MTAQPRCRPTTMPRSASHRASSASSPCWAALVPSPERSNAATPRLAHARTGLATPAGPHEPHERSMAATRRLRCLPCLLRRPTLSPPDVHRRQPAHPEHSLRSTADPAHSYTCRGSVACPPWLPERVRSNTGDKLRSGARVHPRRAGTRRHLPDAHPLPSVPQRRRELRQLHRLVRLRPLLHLYCREDPECCRVERTRTACHPESDQLRVSRRLDPANGRAELRRA